MVEIEWKDPPKRIRGDVRWRLDVLKELKDHPGKWSRVERGVKSRYPKDKWVELGCEASAHRVITETGSVRFDIYARWPEVDLATVDPYIARRRANGVPRNGR